MSIDREVMKMTLEAYNKDKHILLRDMAHKRCIHTDEEYEDFKSRIKAAGIEIFSVSVPEWPPVEKSKLVLMFGGSDPFAGQNWTGMQDACHNEHFNRRVIGEISRNMAPDLFEQDRLAYRWQVPVYDEEKHVIIRDYLAENEVDIVDFYRQYLPKLRAELGRDPIITVTNPHVKQEKEQHGSYGPTKRAMTLDDIAHLRKYVNKSNRFTYELDQAVTWQLSRDRRIWEARRQVPPQSATWMDHKSYIMRPIGAGEWTEEDRDPETGYAFGPFMEIEGDILRVYVMNRAIRVLQDAPMVINGVSISLSVLDEGTGCSVLWSKLDEDQKKAILSRRLDKSGGLEDDNQTNDSDRAGKGKPDRNRGSWKNVKLSFYRRGKFYLPVKSTELPAEYHRKSGNLIVLKIDGDSGCVRAFGDPVLATEPVTVNGIAVKLERWKPGAYQADVGAGVVMQILGKSSAKTKPVPIYKDEEHIEQSNERITGFMQGSAIYTATEVIRALQEELNVNLRLFGRQTSDSAIVALSKESAMKFISLDTVDRQTYVLDTGGRNYDCDNFAESLRCHLVEQHGVNSIGVIWGDKHAWNFVVTSGGGGPEIIMIEPQNDKVVEAGSGIYSIDRRCEVLL